MYRIHIRCILDIPNKQWHEIMKILQGQQGRILTNNSGHPCYDYHTTPVVLASATTTMGTLSTLISLYLPQSPPLLWFRKRVKRFLSFTHAFSYILPVAWKFTSRRKANYQSHGSFSVIYRSHGRYPQISTPPLLQTPQDPPDGH